MDWRLSEWKGNGLAARSLTVRREKDGRQMGDWEDPTIPISAIEGVELNRFRIKSRLTMELLKL